MHLLLVWMHLLLVWKSHGDGFSNFTYLVVPSVPNMHPVVDPPSRMPPFMPSIWELPCVTMLSFACQSAHDDVAAPDD